MKSVKYMNEKQVVGIIGVNLDSDLEFDESMIELENLCKACQFDVGFRIVQNLKKSITGTYVGEGKAQEIKQIAAEKGITTIVINDDLSPSQSRNLEKLTECSILDRSGLILKIFSSRAKTKEAKLQVEIATLKYLLPRLVVRDAGLSQQRGGTGSKSRGTGEKQIDLDRYKVRFRISELEAQLKTIVTERENRRRKRKRNEIPTVAIVGYTNAGKSTLLNYMVRHFSRGVSKEVFEKDMLFATLDTSVRKIVMPNKKAFLLSDTVGFISKLPHELIKAFRSTLEEANEADLILHVVDASNSQYPAQELVTIATLADLGIEDKPMITLLNKVDKLETIPESERANRMYLSAKEGRGMNALFSAIEQQLFADYAQYRMFIPYQNSSDFSYLNEVAAIYSVDEQPEGIFFEMECSPALHAKYCHYDINNH